MSLILEETERDRERDYEEPREREVHIIELFDTSTSACHTMLKMGDVSDRFVEFEEQNSCKSAIKRSIQQKKP